MRDLKARRAAARAKANVKKTEEFEKIEEAQKAKIADELREQLDIKNALVNEDAEAKAYMMSDEFHAALKGIDGVKEEDMENKRRQEQLLKQKHDRMVVDVIGQDLKAEQAQDKEIQQEIERLARLHDPYKEKVSRRAELMNRMADSNITADELEALKRQMKELDDEVKKELGKEEKT